MQLRYVATFTILICSISFIHAQHWIDGTREDTKVMTFEVPRLKPIPRGYEESEWVNARIEIAEKLKDQKQYYELIGMRKMGDIKRYFETLTDESASNRKKDATERRMKTLFTDKQSNTAIPYKGTYLDENLRFNRKTTTLVKYIKYMKEYTKDKDGLINVCWSFQLDTLDFIKSTSSPIGSINGRLPVNTKITTPSADSFYHHYKAKGYIREDIAFFHNNETRIKSIFKTVHFSLCYLEVELEDGKTGFDWIIFISKISDSLKDEGKSIASKKCEPTKIDSSYTYFPVKAYTYLVPGLGWKKKDNKKKIQAWMGITVATIGAYGVGAYYKIKSDKYYKLHKDATTFRALDASYVKANDYNQKAIIFAGSATAIWLISDLWIFLRDRSQVRKFKKMFTSKDDKLNPTTFINPMDGTLSIGVSWTHSF